MKKVRSALENVTGVKEVEVDFDKKEATVKTDGSVKTETLVEALDKAGYKGEVKK